MIDGSHYVIAGVIAILAAVFGLLKRKKKGSPKKIVSPPNNEAADAALDTVQETFGQEVDRIKTATTGDFPADDLADLGNARKRR